MKLTVCAERPNPSNKLTRYGMANHKKPQVSFNEQWSIFCKGFAVKFFDEEDSSDENSFSLLGMSYGAKLLLVCDCEREHGKVICIKTEEVRHHPALRGLRGVFQKHG